MSSAVSHDISRSAPESLAAAARKPRVVFLDVIRGLAALCVLIQHTTEETTTLSSTDRPYLFWSFRWFNLGRVGVAAFFLVSGFVIPYSLERANSLRTFWVSRFFRLYPLYWFSLLVVVAFHLAGNFAISAAYEENFLRVMAVNLTMFQEFLKQPDAIGLYWTLTLELLFYVIFSILFTAGINKKTVLWAWVSLAAMLACGIGQTALHLVNVHHILHRTVPEKLPTARVALISFAFLGTAAFRYYSGVISRRQLSLLALGAAIVFAVAFGLGFRSPLVTTDAKEEWASASMFTSYAGGALLFAVVFLFRNGEFPFPLRWLGMISYSVYLLHYPCWLSMMGIPHHGALSGPIWQLGVFSLTCLVASACYLLIEKPAVELGKHLLRKPKPATELGHPTSVMTAVGHVRVITDG